MSAEIVSLAARRTERIAGSSLAIDDSEASWDDWKRRSHRANDRMRELVARFADPSGSPICQLLAQIDELYKQLDANSLDDICDALDGELCERLARIAGLEAQTSAEALVKAGIVAVDTIDGECLVYGSAMIEGLVADLERMAGA